MGGLNVYDLRGNYVMKGNEKMKSEKTRASLLFTFSLLLFTSAASAETVGYWDPVGKVTNSVEAVVATADTETLTDGWYVATGEVSRNRRVSVGGAVILVGVIISNKGK